MFEEEVREALRRLGIAAGADVPCVVERVKLRPHVTAVVFRLSTEPALSLTRIYEVDQCHPEKGTHGVIRFVACPCANPRCLTLWWDFQRRRMPTLGEN